MITLSGSVITLSTINGSLPSVNASGTASSTLSTDGELLFTGATNITIFYKITTSNIINPSIIVGANTPLTTLTGSFPNVNSGDKVQVIGTVENELPTTYSIQVEFDFTPLP